MWPFFFYLRSHLEEGKLCFSEIVVPVWSNYLMPTVSNGPCHSGLFSLMFFTLILKQEENFSDLLQRCPRAHTSHSLTHPVSMAIREFECSWSFDQSFVSMKYDTG